MPKGKPISIIEIMKYIQSSKGWIDVTVPGEDVIRYTDFQNAVVFDLGLTSDRRKVRELWMILTTSPAIRAYNKDSDTIVVEVYKYNIYLAGAEFGIAGFRTTAGARV